ncbi:ACP phosphodiesterase [Nocardioides sp. Root1257]|uniref:NAD(P)H-dependent oxidoreductase n=1 Tax=unclassified Nocardioides TaxID=2615069 RepID=UPI0006F8FE86|nr:MULTISPECIES: NAD(P)H-dependent oxidoreductase [unclassified Nocardioides]KQW49308.1 ACP phosphodiesterase [Nocardioides sp. Root1257]KRC48482.1 ACP phosphodiesterase [Nocardioides sp. Root224]
MTLLRIDSSIQGPASASSALADLVLDAFIAARPDEQVVSRHLAVDPLPSDAWANAIHASFAPEDQRTPAQAEALALAQSLAAELEEADAAVLALPLYNFGVSQHVKTWFDLVLAGAAMEARPLEGKPVVLLTTRGGAYGEGTPRHGWDHSTDYLRRILVDKWGADLTVVEREFTLVGVNPALDEFTEIAGMMKKEAEEAAVVAGRDLAAR